MGSSRHCPAVTGLPVTSAGSTATGPDNFSLERSDLFSLPSGREGHLLQSTEQEGQPVLSTRLAPFMPALPETKMLGLETPMQVTHHGRDEESKALRHEASSPRSWSRLRGGAGRDTALCTALPRGLCLPHAGQKSWKVSLNHAFSFYTLYTQNKPTVYTQIQILYMYVICIYHTHVCIHVHI